MLRSRSTDILRQFECYQRARIAAERGIKLALAGKLSKARQAQLEMETWYEEYKKAGGTDKLEGFDR